MSELDRFRRAAPGFENASDAEVVREISRRTNQPFEQVADTFGLPVRWFASELGRQFLGGLAVDTPEIVGGALQYFGSREEEPKQPFGRRLTRQTGLERQMLGQPEPEQSLAFRAGTALREGAAERAPEWTPDMRGRGEVAQTFLKAGRGLGPVAAGLVPALLPGGQAISATLIPTAFAGSAAQDTYESLIEQGLSEEAAAAAARRVFGLNYAGETLGTVATLGAAKALRPVFGGAKTTQDVARRLTDTRIMAPALGAIAANVPVQAGTEIFQDVGSAMVERAYGGKTEDLGAIAYESGTVGGAMAILLGPLSFGGARARARRSEELKQALYGENVDPRVRAQAMDFVMAEAQRQNIAPENIDTWFETQLEIEDARTAALAAAEERAAAEALANRDKSLEDMVKQQGLTRGLTDQDLLTPGVTSAQIDRELGIGRKPQDPKKYVKNFMQAFSEPSGQFVQDPETGIERELTMGEYYQRQGGALDLMEEEPTKAAVATEAATQTLRDPRSLFLRDTLGIVPTQPALQLVDAIEQAGIPLDSDIVSPVITFAAQRPLSKKGLEKALQMLDAAIIESRRAATAQQAVAPVVSIPGVPERAGVQPAAAPAVAGLSQGAPVATQVPQAPVGAPAPAAPAAATQQQTAAQTPQAVDDGYASDAEAWDDFRAEDAPTFDQLAPALQQAWAQARRTESMSRDLTEEIAQENEGTGVGGVDPRVRLLAQLFDGANAVRNAEMFIDRVVMGMSLKDVAEKYGMSTSGAAKVVGGEKDAAARMTATLNRARARGVDIRAMQDAMESLATEARERSELDIQNMFGDVEATSADAAQADLGTRTTSVGGSGANIAAKLSELEAKTVEVLTALDAVTDPAKRKELESELEGLVVQYREQERVVQARIRATAGKVSDKETAAGQEQAAAMAVQELGVEDAVQEQAAAEVSVQPEARGRQKVGRQVRRAQEPAPEGQVQARQEVAPAGNIPSRVTALRGEYAQLQRRLDEDGKSAGDDPLGRALSATFNPLQRNDKDAQLFALNYGEQNNRPDIAAEARANLEALADKLEQEAASQSTTPGVPESSPKYQKIKSDLEARKAQKIADAAEIRVRLGQAPSQPAAQTSQEKYAQVVSAVPDAPAFADLTKAQQDQITDLANRDQLNLAAVNRVVGAKEERGPVLENIERLTREPSAYAGDRQRAPSLSRGVATLRRMLDAGRITPEQFTARVEALHDQTQAARQERVTPARQRGADFIRQKLLEAKRRGDLSERAVDMAEWFILQNPALVDDLAVSIRGKGKDGVSGNYDSFRRLMTLMKESTNDETTVHEILHHLERMMPVPMQNAIRKSWLKSLTKAAAAAEKSGDKNLIKFYNHLLDYHIGNAETGGLQSQMNAAIKLLKDGVVDYGHYQHVNPSEFWAVNGSRIMEGRFDVSDSMLGRIKQWLKEFVEKAKAVFGFKSDATVINALNSLIKGDGKFLTGQQMLMEGVDYAELSKAGRREGGGDSALGRIISRASKKFANKWEYGRPVQATFDYGTTFGPYQDPVKFVVMDAGGDYHMFVMSADGAAIAVDVVEKGEDKSLGRQVDVLSWFAGQHYMYDPTDFSFMAAGPAADSWAADELRETNSLGFTGEYWDAEKTQPITRVEGVEYGPLVESLGQFLAFVKTQTGRDTVPVAWERVTGANIGKVGGGYMNLERQPRGTVQQNLNRVPAPARGAASSMVSILGDVGGRVLDRLVFTSDLTNRAVALGMQSAGRLQRALAARDFMAREEERSIESILNGYTDLPDNERGTGDGSVNRFLFDSTRSGKWGYGDRADAELAKRFDAFSGPAKKFIQDVFAHGDRMLQRKKDLVLEATKSEFDAQIAAAKTEAQKADLRKAKQLALKRYETLFKIREGRPYAPIKRTGNYVVIAKSKEYLAAEAAKDQKRMEQLESDGDHYHVSFTDGKMSGQELRRQLEEQGAFADVQLAERDQVTDELFSNEGALQQLSKLRSNVDARVREGDKSATKLLNIINQMYLEALAEGSARKSEMKRRGVDGEVDMISSFAQQGRADANFLASLQYADPVNDALNAMRAEAKTGDRTRKSEVLNELVRRYSDSLDVPNNPWINKLTRASSIYFLLTSPAYYLQNLTQPFMMSVPAMAGRYGYTDANAALFKAYGELGPVMKSAKLLQQLDYSQVPADVRSAINELVNRGRIDIGLDTELGEFKVDPNSKFGAKWNQVDKGMRMAVQKGEAINRLSTAIAAYRLEFAKSKDAKKAIDYADRILLETHGDYSRANAPRMFNHPALKVALQFRKFQLIQLSWYAKMIKQAYSDPVQRGAALRSLAFAVAHTGVLAGAMGLPGYAAAAWLLGSLFGDEDEPFDLTDSIRKMIGDPEVANVILRGVPTLGGGDWSGKIGAGNMLSVMPFSNADLTTRAGVYEALGTLAGGAAGGMVVRGVDGVGLLANGDYMKGFELMLPKGLGDVIKAYRLGTDGATRRNGDVILPESELSALELAWQAIGIPPAQMTAMYEKQQRVRDTEQRFRDRTTSIKNAYTKAIRQGDSADAAKAREDWKNLQDARVRAGLKRQPFSELVRAPREQAKRERETAGGVQFRRGTERMVEDIVER
jgi:hypothetical protein